MSKHWLGVDTGGTFTDFVYFDGKSIRIHKVLSTPHAPEKAILQGIDDLKISCSDLQLVHGSTVATNAVLEGKGVKTVYITNSGFADVLTIGRQARRELYNLMPEPRPPLIASEHCLQINTRLSSNGEVLQPLLQTDIDELIQAVNKIKPAAVAINLLFSFLDPRQEQEIKKQIMQNIGADLFVSCSSDVLPEYKEYERGMATVLNSYVGPLMQGYLTRLAESVNVRAGVQNSDMHSIGDSRQGKNTSLKKNVSSTDNQFPGLSVLHSAAGTISAQQAAYKSVNLLLSGPAGGLKGAQFVTALSGETHLLSFDMGGTSTDVALINGEIQLTSEASIAGYPVAVPMVDMQTIGAGGGSIAYVDAGGMLNVGPQSAGASPGPACYAQGGVKPTVTDANLILGRLRADAFLGKQMALDVDAAKTAMAGIAEQLNISVEAAAEGVVRIANEHMVRALREISVQRGYDPQDFVLTCFGGAGGLHVCALANELSMRSAIVPIHGGVLSALGMLVAEPARELSHSFIQLLSSPDSQPGRQPDSQAEDSKFESSLEQGIENLFNELESRGLEEMQHELNSKPVLQRSVDLRYKGQSFTLNLPWSDVKNTERSFHMLHESTYGHQFEMPVELVNLRLSIKGQAPPFNLPRIQSAKAASPVAQVSCYGLGETVAVYAREQLVSGQKITGPALILETVSTTLIAPEWSCEVDAWGSLLLHRSA